MSRARTLSFDFEKVSNIEQRQHCESRIFYFFASLTVAGGGLGSCIGHHSSKREWEPSGFCLFGAILVDVTE